MPMTAKGMPKKPPVKPVVAAPMPPPVATMPAGPRKDCSDNLGQYLHPKGGMKAPAKPMAPSMKPTAGSKIGPNTTASPKARSVTAGPNSSFPIGTAKNARLAIPMSTRSERAGNITPAQVATIKAKARAKLGK